MLGYVHPDMPEWAHQRPLRFVTAIRERIMSIRNNNPDYVITSLHHPSSGYYKVRRFTIPWPCILALEIKLLGKTGWLVVTAHTILLLLDNKVANYY